MSKVNVLGVQMWEGEEERERMRLEEKMIRECLNQMVIQGKSMLIAVILFYFILFWEVIFTSSCIVSSKKYDFNCYPKASHFFSFLISLKSGVQEWNVKIVFFPFWQDRPLWRWRCVCSRAVPVETGDAKGGVSRASKCGLSVGNICRALDLRLM